MPETRTPDRRIYDRIIRALTALLIVLTIIAQTGCGSATGGGVSAEPVTSENFFLDTVCTISVYEMTGQDGAPVPAKNDEEDAQAAIDKAWELCSELDAMLSRTHEGSDIYRINNSGGKWTKVSESTRELIQRGMEYSYSSDGDFDITVGSLTEQWDFHAEPEDAVLPDADVLEKAAKHVNYRNLAIEGNKVKLTDPESKLDLGGIAKGYIGDRLTEVLEEEGVTSAIINLGGNVICIGGKDNSSSGDEGAFVIGVEAPFSDRTEIVGTIAARDMTLVTSGIYERKIEKDGKIYHHVLDTKTGWPVETDLVAVTLTADKGCSGDIDALSTTCLIKGSEDAKDLIEETDGVEAVFILNDGTIEQSSGMEFVPVK